MLSSGVSAQEAKSVPQFPYGTEVQPAFAMCIAWDPWLEIEKARRAGDDDLWYALMRPALPKGVCKVTRGADRLRFVGELSYNSDRTIWAFHVADADGFVYYISPAAYEDP